jgi:hypothetical protein
MKKVIGVMIFYSSTVQYDRYAAERHPSPITITSIVTYKHLLIQY